MGHAECHKASIEHLETWSDRCWCAHSPGPALQMVSEGQLHYLFFEHQVLIWYLENMFSDEIRLSFMLQPECVCVCTHVYDLVSPRVTDDRGLILPLSLPFSRFPCRATFTFPHSVFFSPSICVRAFHFKLQAISALLLWSRAPASLLCLSGRTVADGNT